MIFPLLILGIFCIIIIIKVDMDMLTLGLVLSLFGIVSITLLGKTNTRKQKINAYFFFFMWLIVDLVFAIKYFIVPYLQV